MPPEFQELVHRRQREQGNSGTYEGSCQMDDTNSNFKWDRTPEGYEFWSNLFHSDKDMTSHPMYPKPLVPEYSIF